MTRNYVQPSVDLNRFDVEFRLESGDDSAYYKGLQSRQWARLFSFDESWTIWFFVLFLPVVVALLSNGTDLMAIIRNVVLWATAGLGGLATILHVARWVLPYINARYGRHRVTIDRHGFIDRTDAGSVSAGWDDVRNVRVVDQCIAIEYRRSRWYVFDALLLIPMRAFSSYAEHQAFLATCRRLWAR